MAIRLNRWLLCSVIFPLSVHAASCEDITEQIKHDTEQYGSQLANHSLPWLCLNWLEQQLGPITAKMPIANRIRYTWECSHRSDTKLTVFTDTQNNIVAIEGQYSTAQGAGLFSQPVNAVCETAPQPTAAILPTPTTTACDATAEEIYAVARIAMEHPYLHLPFAWENKTWLQQTYGEPNIHTATATTAYIWHCQRDAMTTIGYNNRNANSNISTTLCKGTECYLATLTRHNDALQGDIQTIAAKPI